MTDCSAGINPMIECYAGGANCVLGRRREFDKIFALLDWLSRTAPWTLNCTGISTVKFNPGKRVQSTINYSATIYLVKDGLLITRRFDPFGMPYAVAFPRIGDIVGFELFAASSEMSETVAVTDATLVAIPLKLAQEFVRASEEFETTLYAVLGRYLQSERDRFLSYPRSSAPGRVARFLLAESNDCRTQDGGNAFFLQIRYGDIASFVGVRLETLSRILNAFHELGYIARDKRRIEICNYEALSSCCYDTSGSIIIHYSSTERASRTT